jgi:hypothetical protein
MLQQIDLKHTQIFIRDGYNAVAQVNLTAGYAVGLATMAIDSTGAGVVIPVGATFLIGADPTIYQVTAHTETSGATTSITFAPPLVAMATDNEAIAFQPNEIEVRIGEGNFTYNEKYPRKYVLNRQVLNTVKDDDQVPLDVTFDFVWDHIAGTASDPPTVHEALKQVGNASTWVTSDTDTCQPYSVDLILLYTPECAVEPEQIVFPTFRWDTLSPDLKNGTVSCKGSCNVQSPIATRISA